MSQKRKDTINQSTDSFETQCTAGEKGKEEKGSTESG